jgi:cytochrome c-type biogenesis protein CcmH/NrfF
MVAQFGPAVLSTPQTHGFDLIAWVLPIGGILVAAVALAFGARAWSKGRDASPGLVPDDLAPEDARRVDDALKRFE